MSVCVCVCVGLGGGGSAKKCDSRKKDRDYNDEERKVLQEVNGDRKCMVWV